MATLIEQIQPGVTNALEAATRINEALRETGGGLILDGTLSTGGTINPGGNISFDNSPVSYIRNSIGGNISIIPNGGAAGYGVGLDIRDNSVLRWENNDIYHAGNANLSSVDWAANNGNFNKVNISVSVLTGVKTDAISFQSGGNVLSNISSQNSGGLNQDIVFETNSGASVGNVVEVMRLQGSTGDSIFSGSIITKDISNRQTIIKSPQSGIHGSIGLLGTNESLDIGTRDFATAISIDGLTGNVGIDIDEPTELLDVAGSAIIGDHSVRSRNIRIRSDVALSPNPGVSAFGGIIEAPDSGNLLLDLRNNDALDSIAFRYASASDGVVDTIGFVMKGNGNVGIGTTAPEARLHVSSTYIEPTGGISSATQGIFSNNIATNGNSSISILSRSSGIAGINFGTQLGEVNGFIKSSFIDGLSLGTANTERLTIDTTGNVGIGATTPSSELDVAGRTTTQNLNISSLPTSAAGLSSGDVWRDGTDLKIVV